MIKLNSRWRMWMSKFTTDAITLKSYSLGESDKIVVMYSKDRGLIRAVAKGVKKPKSKLGSCVDNLIASRFLIAKGKKLDIISQAQGVNTFLNLRKDFSKLSYAMYCADLLYAFAVEDDSDSQELYSLFCDVLEAISSSGFLHNTVLCVLKFQLNLMETLGYSVELDSCVKCCASLNKNAVFSSAVGGTVCCNCSGESIRGPVVSIKIVDFMRKVKVSEFSNKYFKDEEISSDSVVIFCFNLMKEYISQRSPKKIKAQDFLEMVN